MPSMGGPVITSVAIRFACRVRRRLASRAELPVVTGPARRSRRPITCARRSRDRRTKSRTILKVVLQAALPACSGACWLRARPADRAACCSRSAPQDVQRSVSTTQNSAVGADLQQPQMGPAAQERAWEPRSRGAAAFLLTLPPHRHRACPESEAMPLEDTMGSRSQTTTGPGRRRGLQSERRTSPPVIGTPVVRPTPRVF